MKKKNTKGLRWQIMGSLLGMRSFGTSSWGGDNPAETWTITRRVPREEWRAGIPGRGEAVGEALRWEESGVFAK